MALLPANSLHSIVCRCIACNNTKANGDSTESSHHYAQLSGAIEGLCQLNDSVAGQPSLQRVILQVTQRKGTAWHSMAEHGIGADADLKVTKAEGTASLRAFCCSV